MTTPNLLALDHQSIKEDLKNYLKNQNEFSDYNFDGSGFNVLLNLLAYNAQHAAYLASMVANESEIDSAILRSNVVSRAKLMGYTPKSITAARAMIKISISNTREDKTSLLLPRGTVFSSNYDGKTYPWVVLDDYNLEQNEDGVFEAEIEIAQGTLVAYSWTIEDIDERIVLPSKSIDISTLKVAVFDTETAETHTVFERSTTAMDITSDSEVYWLQETRGELFELKFGDGVFGKALQVGNYIYLEGLDTVGASGNYHTDFSLVGSFEGYDNSQITITTLITSNSGASNEQSSSIKLNAVRFYQSQNRAVTKNDFVAVVSDVYPNSTSIAVWGGEEMTPPEYGKVYVCIVPTHKNALTSGVRKRIADQVRERTVAGIDVEVVNPQFIYLNLKITCLCESSIAGVGSVSSGLRTTIQNYFQKEFGVFNRNFYESQLLSLINSYSNTIISSKITTELSTIVDYNKKEISLFNKIKKGSVRSSSVTEGTLYDDGNGNVVATNNSTVLGTVDYDSGKITMTNDYALTDTQTEFFATPEDDDVESGLLSILLLNDDRLQIVLEAQ